MRQLKICMMKENSIREIGELPRTKAGMKSIKDVLLNAVRNLIAGMRWDRRNGT